MFFFHKVKIEGLVYGEVILNGMLKLDFIVKTKVVILKKS